jgi:ribosomal protein L11 methylase PrmA
MLKWHECMTDSGFVAYTSPFFIVGEPDKLTSYTKWQTKRNFHSILVFHKADVKPQVSAAFVRDMGITGEPTKAQNVLSAQLWNAAVHSKTIMKVPDGERARAGSKGKEAKEALRVQQLSSVVSELVIQRWGRALDAQKPVLVVDLFMGCGGAALAAYKLECPFIGVDRDEACVAAAEEMFFRLIKTPVNRTHTHCTLLRCSEYHYVYK